MPPEDKRRPGKGASRSRGKKEKPDDGQIVDGNSVGGKALEEMDAELRAHRKTSKKPKTTSAAPESAEKLTPPPPPDPLQPQHRKLVVASAISPEVAAERGYRTITVKAELKTLGFTDKQCSVPTLYVPVWGVNGEIVGHQIRPDTPRVGKHGKPLKYENPRGGSMNIDVPPRVRQHLRNTRMPLFVTEGVRKADSAASIGIACIALLGVWNWRGSRSDGGKAALPDWDSIALNDRDVYVVYDSDVTTKGGVREALRRLKEFLEQRKARVKIVYLPGGPNGEKVGLDDFLAQGKTEADLIALAKSELPPKPETQAEPSFVTAEYRAFAGGIALVHFDEEGGETLQQITNFRAEIVTSVVEDDGVSTHHIFELEVQRQDQERTIEIPAGDFGAMTWVPDMLGPTYIVMAGFGTRDHARAAIQQLSHDPEQRVVYTHTGWRKLGAGWAYLFEGGAIGAAGCVPGVTVRLEGTLTNFVLPPPPVGDDLKRAVQAGLQLLDVARAIFRAVLGRADLSMHLAGPTGVWKSELAALAQQFFGKSFTARNLPGNWSSTGNALESLAFKAQDALFTVDDFVPRGGANDVARLNREADRLLRGQGNCSGRQRMNADGTLRPTRSPRGLILSTGEDIPAGQSLRARLLVVEISRGDVSQIELTRCQKDAADGVYAAMMAGYVRWLAPQREGLEQRLRKRVNELRAQVAEHSSASHRRTPDLVAQLFAAIEMFLAFARYSGAVAEHEAEALKKRAWAALIEASDQQTAILDVADPVTQFFALLKSAIGGGEAYLTDEHGHPPHGWQHEAVGWHRSSTGDSDYRLPRGIHVGWLVGDDLFLDPNSAFRAAQKLAEDHGKISVSPRTLGRRLAERGCLVRQDSARGKHTVRKVLQDARRDLLHIRLLLLLEKAQSAHEAHAADSGPGDCAGGPETWASDPTEAACSGPRQRPTTTPPAGIDCEPGSDGPDGPLPKTGQAQCVTGDVAPQNAEVRSCYSCRGTSWWRRAGSSSEWFCRRCAPPATSEIEVRDA